MAHLDCDGDSVCSTETLAVILGLTRRRVNQLEKRGVLKKTRKNTWLVVENVRRYVESFKTQDSQATLFEERLRLTSAQADRAEIENKKLTGELVSAAEVLEKWQYLLGLLKSRITAVPGAVSVKLARESKTAAVKKILTRELHECLLALADNE